MPTTPPPAPEPPLAVHPGPLKLAKALLRRVAKPIAATIDRRTYTVEPFGYRLTIQSPMLAGIILSRRVTTGIVLGHGAFTNDKLITAAILSRIEALAGTARRWEALHVTSAVSTLHYRDGDSDPLPAPRDMVLFDPLVSMLLDTEWANVTPMGHPRDWQAEARDWLKRQPYQPRFPDE